MSSGGLWSTDRDSFYAVSGWVRHRGQRPRPEHGWYTHGRRVTVAYPRAAYGYANSRLGGGRGGTVSHYPDRLYLIWSEGRLVGSFVHWECGSLTDQYTLESEPSYRVCPSCLVRAMGQAGVSVQVIVNLDPGVG